MTDAAAIASRGRPSRARRDRATLDFYAARCQQFGDDIRAVAWGSRASQRVRFGVLSPMVKPKSASVLDLGCGLGDLYDHLHDHGFTGRYTGWDVSPEMIAIARQRHPQVEFGVCDIRDDQGRRSFDYVLASGIFNRKTRRSRADLRAIVTRMFESCRRGVGFNVMSAHADFQNADEHYERPDQLLVFCLTLTRKVVLHHDYMPHDVTIWMYR